MEIAERKYDVRRGAFEPVDYYRAEHQPQAVFIADGVEFPEPQKWAVINGQLEKVVRRYSDEADAKRAVGGLNRNGWII